MKKLALLLFIMILGVGIASAQKVVNGKVTDESGAPLIGVNVLVKDTNIGTITDLDGTFNLNVPEGSNILLISFVGFASQEVDVSGVNSVEVTLSEGTVLDEIVFVAYGTQKKSEITGAVSVVKSEDIEKIQESNVLKGLDGKVSGVQIIQDDGQPGSSPTIRIRGIGSISGSSSPLYIVDGVSFNEDAVATIDPMDIASISVLKDASANALYGHRAANGVIIITTKKGEKGALNVTADLSLGYVTRGVSDYDILTEPGDFLQAAYNASRNNLYVNEGYELTEASQLAASNLITDVDGLGYQLGYNNYDVGDSEVMDPNTGMVSSNANLLYSDNWADHLFANAYKNKAYLSMASGTDNSTYFFSFGNEQYDGYAIKSGFNRTTLRFSTEQYVRDYLEVGGSLHYAHSSQDAPIQDYGSGTYANLFNWARIVAPIYPVYAYDMNGNAVLDQNGENVYDFGDGQYDWDGNGAESPWRRTFGGTRNPVAVTLANIQNNIYDNAQAKIYGTLRFLDGFYFTYNGSANVRLGTLTEFNTPIGGDAKNAGGRGYATSLKAFLMNHQQLLGYEKDLGVHSISALFGHESTDYNYRYLEAHKTNYLLSNQAFLDGAVVIESVANFERDYKIEGYFSRLSYEFDNKYALNLSYRFDASSVFHPDNRWGNFWGAGLSWNIAREDFMSDVDFLDHFRIKASYGQLGNDIVFYPSTTTRNYYPFRDQYAVVKNGDDVGIVFSYLGNEDLTWEKSSNINAGFEARMMDNRLGIDFDYFTRKVSDMLYNKPLPMSSGAPSLPQNIGDMTNIGYEMNLYFTPVKTKDFTWDINLNGTHYSNKIDSLPEDFIDDGRFRLVEGRSRYAYHMREFAGVDPENGEALWYVGGLDEDGELNGEERETTDEYAAADEYYLEKDAIPDFYGGFGTSFTYKDFDFGVSFTYQYGGYGYDGVYYNLFDATDAGQNFTREGLEDTWTPENTDAALPRLDAADGENFFGSSMWLIDASYLSLKNISLGYTLDIEPLKKIGVESIRIYGSADNVYLWSKRKGFDPRLDLTGQSLNEYSIMRTMTAGLKINF
jgi:TonB-linked SusC/RagA family outer membrane protein